MRKVQFELMRPGEIVAEKGRCPVVYVPIGPLEWHGPHLPLGVDPLRAHEVAVRVAREVGGVVLPTFFWGTERERSPEMLRNIGFKGDEWIVGMDFPKNSMKSLYCREEYFAILVRELVDILENQEYKTIVIVNGHGAQNHVAVLDRLCAEFSAKKKIKIMHVFVTVMDEKGEYNWAHAAREETSVMMALYPESVDLSTLPPKDRPLRNVDWGIVDNLTFRGHPTEDCTVREDPRVGSSKELGEENLKATATQIVEKIKQVLLEIGIRE